jgi:hypothetical protein
VAILDFHASPLAWAPIAAMALVTWTYPPFTRFRPWMWRSLAAVALLTVPWALQATRGYGSNTALLSDLSSVARRALQAVIEYASVTPLLAVAVLAGILYLRRRRAAPTAAPRHGGRSRVRRGPEAGVALRASLFTPDERALLVVSTAIAAAYLGVLALTQSAQNLYVAGLRYASPLGPLTAGVTALLVWRATATRRAVGLVVMLVLTLTPLGQLTPWAPLLAPARGSQPTVHVPADRATMVANTPLLSLAHELLQGRDGVITGITDFLRTHAKRGDILITNYGWEAIYFRTGLPQGLKINSTSPVYAAAKRDALPDYVFTVTGARWVVWRGAWEGYLGYHWNDVSKRLVDRGATLSKVAQIPETLWENRENLHFHRFAGDGYLFLQVPAGPFPPAEIYRVDWPGGGAGDRPAGGG